MHDPEGSHYNKEGCARDDRRGHCEPSAPVILTLTLSVTKKGKNLAQDSFREESKRDSSPTGLRMTDRVAKQS